MRAVDDDPTEIARLLSENRENLAGTLRFFGQWFGRAYDNLHRMTKVTTDREDLVISFDDSEILRVTGPSGLELAFRPNGEQSRQPPLLTIRRASRVHWEFAKYGPETPRRRFYIDYRPEGARMNVETNINWFRLDGSATSKAAAVELY